MDEKAGYHDRERPTFIHPLRQIHFNSQLKERENYLAGGGGKLATQMPLTEATEVS